MNINDKMEQLIQNCLSAEETQKVKSLIGARVLSVKGEEIGKVKDIHLNPKKLTLEGIQVSTGIFRRLFIDKTYLKQVSGETVILNIDPLPLLIGKAVLTKKGELIGKVKTVIRKEQSNELHHILVKKGLTRTVQIMNSQIELIGESIILKGSYDATRSKIWKNNSR